MVIIDDRKSLLVALEAHGLTLEDFFQTPVELSSEQLLKSPLAARSDLALIDVPSLAQYPVNDQLLAILNTFVGVILFVPDPTDKTWKSWVEQVLAVSDKILSVQYIPQSEGSWTLLRNQMLWAWRLEQDKTRFKEQLVRFSSELDTVVRATHAEALAAKKIHEDVVPRRAEDIKGLGVTSKYAVGEGSGSEYFDIIKGQQYVHIVMMHTDSYLASSCLMGILNKWKGPQVGVFDMHLFAQEAWMEIQSINMHKKKPVKAQVFLGKIDLSTFHISGLSFGEFELFSRSKGKLPLPQGISLEVKHFTEAAFEFVLERGEKMVVFSPGFRFNWKEGQPGISQEEFTTGSWQLSSADFIMEHFFRLKKAQNGEALAKDATAVLLEVNRHAIHKV